MGALDFLNQGNSPASNSNYSQTSTQLPPAFQDYIDQYLQKTAQFANTPYQTYDGPRIAGQTDMTKAAQGQVSSLGGAPGATTQAAQNLINTGASANNPLGAAQPYLDKGTDPTYNNVDKYMNPYNRNVTDQIAAAGMRNFNQNIMPGMDSRAIAAGNITGNSTQTLNMQNNAAQEEQRSIQEAQAGALQNGFASSLSAANADKNANLQAGQVSGALTNAQVNNDANLGALTSQVGTTGINNGLNVAGAGNQMGVQNQQQNQSNLDLAYQDFLRQQQDPLNKAGVMGGAIGNVQSVMPHGQTNYTYGTGVNGGNGSYASPQTSPLQTLFNTGYNYAGNTAKP